MQDGRAVVQAQVGLHRHGQVDQHARPLAVPAGVGRDPRTALAERPVGEPSDGDVGAELVQAPGVPSGLGRPGGVVQAGPAGRRLLGPGPQGELAHRVLHGSLPDPAVGRAASAARRTASASSSCTSRATMARSRPTGTCQSSAPGRHSSRTSGRSGSPGAGPTNRATTARRDSQRAGRDLGEDGLRLRLVDPSGGESRGQDGVLSQVAREPDQALRRSRRDAQRERHLRGHPEVDRRLVKRPSRLGRLRGLRARTSSYSALSMAALPATADASARANAVIAPTSAVASASPPPPPPPPQPACSSDERIEHTYDSRTSRRQLPPLSTETMAARPSPTSHTANLDGSNPMQMVLGPRPGPLAVDDLPAAYPWPPGRLWVRAMMVMTLDGATVGPDGRSRSISSVGDRRVFNAARRFSDVVLIGAGTFRAERYRPMRWTEGGGAGPNRPQGLARAPQVAIVSGSLDLPWEEPIFAESDVPQPVDRDQRGGRPRAAEPRAGARRGARAARRPGRPQRAVGRARPPAASTGSSAKVAPSCWPPSAAWASWTRWTCPSRRCCRAAAGNLLLLPCRSALLASSRPCTAGAKPRRRFAHRSQRSIRSWHEGVRALAQSKRRVRCKL